MSNFTVTRRFTTGVMPNGIGTKVNNNTPDAKSEPVYLSTINACPDYVSNPNNYIEIEKKERVDNLAKTEWECSFIAHRVEPATGNKCMLGEVTAKLGKRSRDKRLFTYDGIAVTSYISRLKIEVSQPLLEQNEEARQALRLALNSVIERSRELGFNGRVEWRVRSLSEFQSAQEMGFLKSKDIKEDDDRLRDILDSINSGVIYEKIIGLSFDLRFGVRMYLPVENEEAESSLNHSYHKITDDEYRRIFPSEECLLNQGDIGDCYLIASLKAIAKNERKKEIFQQLIEINEDSYRITFPEFPNIPVTVSKHNLDQSQGYLTSSVNGDVGYKIIEEAYARLLLKRTFCTENLPALAGSMLNGSYPALVLQAITGIKSTCFNTNGKDSLKVHDETFKIASRKKPELVNSLNAFLERLRADFNNYAITACTQFNSFPVEGDDRFVDLNKRFRKGHAYTIVGLDENKIRIVDPLFGGSVQEISVDEFIEYFSAIQAIKF